MKWIARVWKLARWRKREKLWRQLAIGFNSSVQVENDIHLVMLDFDIQDVEKVKESIRECQKFWNLADCYVYRTKNGFHAIFYEDQVPYGRVRMIIEFAKYVDQKYKYVSRFYDHKTLRVAGKHGKEQDIVGLMVLPGEREPSPVERERGRLKREEHAMLLRMRIEEQENK